MEVNRRNQIVLGALVVLLAAAIYAEWPSTTAVGTTPSNVARDSRTPGQGAGASAPDVHLQALETDRHMREVAAQRAVVMERYASLTPREREVTERVTAGKANKVIAAELNLSTKTVEVHRANVMKKMEVDSVAELVRLSFLLQPTEGKP